MIIGISGAFCDNNFGDYTMLINNIYDFMDSDVQIDKIIIFCYEKSLVQDLCRDYFNSYNVEVFELKISIERADQNSFMGVDHTDDCFTPMEILRTVQNIEDLHNVIQNVDLMVSCGGGHFDYYWLGLKRRYRLFSIIAPCIVARHLHKNVVMLGHSFGPWGNNKEFFLGLFNYINFDAINCRDNLYSKKNLNAICVTDNIHEVCDDLSLINNRIDNLVRNKKNNFSNYYILDIYSSIQDIEHNIEDIISFVQKMKEERGLIPVFIPHGPEYNGARQSKLLKKYIPELIVYESERNYLPPEEFILLLKDAHFVLCEHYHSFVLALTHKVPAIMFIRKIDGNHFYYYNKTVGFLKISGVLSKSEIGEELFCTLSLPELFDSSEVFNMKIEKIKAILSEFSFELGDKKKDYIRYILNICEGGGIRK